MAAIPSHDAFDDDTGDSYPPPPTFAELVDDLPITPQALRCGDCAFECMSADELAHHLFITCHCMLPLNNQTYVPRGLDEPFRNNWEDLSRGMPSEMHRTISIIPNLPESQMTQPLISARSIEELAAPAPDIYRCGQCHLVVSTRDALLKHLSTKHKSPIPVSDRETVITSSFRPNTHSQGSAAAIATAIDESYHHDEAAAPPSQYHCEMLCWECLHLDNKETVLAFDGEPLDENGIAIHSAPGRPRISIAAHMKATGSARGKKTHIAIAGVYRSLDFFVYKPNRIALVPNQIACPECNHNNGGDGGTTNKNNNNNTVVSFTQRLHYAVHCQEHHPLYMAKADLQDTARCLDCGRKMSLRQMLDHSLTFPDHSIVAIGGRSLDVPPVKRPSDEDPRQGTIARHRLISGFQCPTCFRLFETWEQTKRHISESKHSLPICLACGEDMPYDVKYVMEHLKDPKCSGGQGLTHILYGQQRYQVMIDPSDPDQFRMIQEAVNRERGAESKLEAEWTNQLDHVKFVYQCPLKTCLKVYPVPGDLIEHLRASKHGLTVCPQQGCGASLRVWDGSHKQHEHPVHLPVTSHLVGKESIEDFVVWFHMDDLVAYFPSYYGRCAHCNLVVDILTRRHEEFGECQMAQALLGKKANSNISNNPRVGFSAWTGAPNRIIVPPRIRGQLSVKERFD